jgi:hypothetical protein
MRRHALLTCLTMALAVPLFPGVAHADDAAVVEAKARFEEGLALADAGKHEPARLKFQQAWAVFKSPAVLYNLARAEQLTGHDMEALEHFRAFARLAATDAKITDAMRDKAKQNADELGRKVGQIAIEAPSSARVTVDGKPVDLTQREPVPVAPGRHTVEAAFEGRLKSVVVECLPGNITSAKLDFVAGEASYPPGEEPRGGSSARWIVPTVLGVAGLAGIGVGIGFGASSQSAKTDAETLRRENPGLCAVPPSSACATYDTKRDDADSAATLSYVGYIAGGALLAGAAVSAIILWPRSKSHAATKTQRGFTAESVTPMLGSGTLGAAFQGHF